MTLGEGFTAAGYLTGGIVLYLSAKSRGLATLGVAAIGAVGFCAGLLGAKLSELIFEGWPFRHGIFVGIEPQAGGRALLGGLICGWLAVVWAKRKLGITRPIGDLFALALPAGEIVGRVGCYFNGCCFGTPTSDAWAVYQHGAWRHPAQLSSSLTALAILCVLLVLRKALVREGDLFKLYLLLFGATRFGLEFVRENDTRWFGLTPMQWFCMELVVFGALSLLPLSARLRLKPR